MARMTLGRDLGWMDYRTWESTDEDGAHWMHLAAEPKRLYALRPSFWLFAIRHMTLRIRRGDVIASGPEDDPTVIDEPTEE